MAIVWIDNQLDYAEAHLELLREWGYVIRDFWNIEEAMRHLQRPGNEYDLIILDVLMGKSELLGKPVENGKAGITALEILRRDLIINTPILFLTVMLETEVLKELKKLDFSSQTENIWIMQKPVRPSKLYDKVRTILET